MGIGVAAITKVDLGTSPISTVPYVLSFIVPGSFGFWTFVLGLAFIVLQGILLGNFKDHILYLQLLVNPILGISIDVGMWIVKYVPSMLLTRLLFLLVGCFILATGIYLQIQASFVMNPGEGIVKVISDKLQRPFGIIKIWFDWLLVTIAALIGLAFLKMPVGIGIGTLISAFLVGYFVKLITKWELIERMNLRKFEEG